MAGLQAVETVEIAGRAIANRHDFLQELRAKAFRMPDGFEDDLQRDVRIAIAQISAMALIAWVSIWEKSEERKSSVETRPKSAGDGSSTEGSSKSNASKRAAGFIPALRPIVLAARSAGINPAAR